MKTKAFLIVYFLLMSLATINSNAQDASSTPKNTSVKTIWDIPHKTLSQKWMWMPRSTAFIITKERTVNYDTDYIKSYYKRLVITLPISTRLLKFSLMDLNSGNKLIFVPNLQYDLGIGVCSRWVSFIVNTGVKIFTKDNDIKGTTKYHDFQLNLYGRKITTDIFVQNYSGFYIKNSKSYNNYISDTLYAIRSDVRASNIGVSSYYIVNNKKISYRNSFAFAEQQKKSAGSLLLGIYYFYFDASGNPSLVSYPFSSSFNTLSLIRSGRIQNFGLNLGYIYTLVFLKKCYATASLVQGIGGEQVNYARDDNSAYHHFFFGTGKSDVRFALGYDNGRYIVGAMGMFEYFLSIGKVNSNIDYSFGKFMIFVGYRFSILKAERKLLHSLKLIDY
ncbi:MAG: DUF4421 family protein [Bacteroidales bacterium]|jgi:hypothetical protein